MLPQKWSPLFMCVLLAQAIASGQTTEKTPRTALDVKAAGTKVFYIDNRAGNNQISFISESMLEDFTSVCNMIGGQCNLDPKHLETFTDRFFLKTKDIKTGIALRDEHLRSADWLDAKRYPEIVIRITKVADIKKVKPNTATMLLIGTCSLHGKTRKVQIPSSLTYLDESPVTMRRVKGDLIRIRGGFNLKLSDYGITGPKGSDIIGLKVADVLKIKISVFGSTERPPDPLKVDMDGPSTQPSTQPTRALPHRRPPPKRPERK